MFNHKERDTLLTLEVKVTIRQYGKKLCEKYSYLILTTYTTLSSCNHAPASIIRGHIVFVLSVCLAVVNFNLCYNF